MRFITLFLSLIFSVSAFASGGFTWLGGLAHTSGIPENVLTFLLISIILIVVGLVYRKKVAAVDNVVIPDDGITLRNLVESYGEFIYGQCKSVIGEKEAGKYFPFIATLFIVILLSNLIGLIPGFLPPTEHLSTTFALGVFSFLYYNWEGVKEQGLINYIKHFAGPLWYMAFLIFPLEIISNLFRPVSLALRLRGNMFGDHMVLSIFTDLAPFLVPIVFYMLGILVCVVQAYVFTVLSMVYIALAVEHHDHDEHAAH
jgi:F-type H+-transporting ATPase subunit a